MRLAGAGQGAHLLTVDRGLAEVEAEVAVLPELVAVEFERQRGELVHVQRACHRPAPEAELGGGGVVVDRAVRLRGGVHRLAEGSDDVVGFGRESWAFLLGFWRL